LLERHRAVKTTSTSPVKRAESGGNVLGQLRGGGGVDGIGAREGFQGPELIEGLDDLFWIGQNGNRVRLEACAGGVACFELAVENEGGEGEFLGRQAEADAKEDFGRPAPVESHQAHPFFEVAAAGQEVEGFLDEGLPVERDQAGIDRGGGCCDNPSGKRSAKKLGSTGIFAAVSGE
jgi:hypothetical protein